jgi:uncharacterized protein (TIGR00369 family)
MDEKKYLDAVTKATEEWIAFNKVLGIKVEELRHGYARFRIPFRPELLGDPVRPAIHGGVLSALVDACGGAACFTMVRVHDSLSTVDLRVDYLRPAKPADLICESEVIRMGNRVACVKSSVRGPDSDDPVVVSMAVYNVRRVKREDEDSPRRHRDTE